MHMPVRALSGLTIAATAALVALVGLTACTSSSRPPAPSSNSVSGPTAADTPPSEVTDTIAVPTDTITITTASSSTPATTAAPASNAPAPHESTPATAACTSSDLAVSAQSGGAASGQEFATLRFTNTSNAPCTLTGFPAVSLLLNGTPLAGAATHSAAAGKTVTLAPQANVTAQLTDDSTCNAANSDTLKVYPPNLTAAVQIPFVLRGCAMVIAPVAAS